MTTEHVGVVDSQRLYEYTLSKKGKLPDTYKMERTIYTLKKDQFEKIYDIVAGNRDNVRGTTLDLELNDKGEVTKIIGSEAHILQPNEIKKKGQFEIK